MSASEESTRLERLRAQRATLDLCAPTVYSAAHQAECERLDAEIAEAQGASLVGAGFSRENGDELLSRGETHDKTPEFLNGWGNNDPKPVAD